MNLPLSGTPVVLHGVTDAYQMYADFIEDLVEGESYKDDVDEETSAASEKIAVAQDTFK